MEPEMEEFQDVVHIKQELNVTIKEELKSESSDSNGAETVIKTEEDASLFSYDDMDVKNESFATPMENEYFNSQQNDSILEFEEGPSGIFETIKVEEEPNISTIKEEKSESSNYDSEETTIKTETNTLSFLSDVTRMKYEQSSAATIDYQCYTDHDNQNEDLIMKFEEGQYDVTFNTMGVGQEFLSDTSSDMMNVISAHSSQRQSDPLLSNSDENINQKDEIQSINRSKQQQHRYSSRIYDKLFTKSGHHKKQKLSHTGRPYKCDICPKSFTQLQNLKLHVHTHTGQRPYTCEICNKSFSQQGNRRTHMLTHTGQRPYICEICNKTFTQNGDLKRHKYTHTGQRPYTCKICNKSFSECRYLQRHRHTHTGERPYTCKLCNKTFIADKNFKAHLLTHTGRRPFTCKICNKRFTLHQHLKTHLFIHTGERPHTCEICKKSFTQHKTLQTHMLIHTGQKPFTCEICKRAFAHQSTLSKHIISHTGQRPYTCGICSKSFTRRDSLMPHMFTHTGQRPHKCEVCNKTFIQFGNLKKHIVRKHKGHQS